MSIQSHFTFTHDFQFPLFRLIPMKSPFLLVKSQFGPVKSCKTTSRQRQLAQLQRLQPSRGTAITRLQRGCFWTGSRASPPQPPRGRPPRPRGAAASAVGSASAATPLPHAPLGAATTAGVVATTPADPADPARAILARMACLGSNTLNTSETRRRIRLRRSDAKKDHGYV